MDVSNYIGRTPEQIFQECINNNSCDEFTEKLTVYIFRSILPNIKVSCGIVYPKGIGPSFSIQDFLKESLKQIIE